MLDWDERGLLKENIGEEGVGIPELEERLEEAKRAYAKLQSERMGPAAFLGILDTDSALQSVSALRRIPFDPKTIVVLGIGGSYAGAATALQALGIPSGRKVILLPSIFPETVERAIEELDPSTTLVNVVSKSGTTVETLSQFGVFWEVFKRALDKEAKAHFVFTTDPERGFLRKFALQEGILTLEIPPSLGGRFSVLSPVGLFPMAVAGIDVQGVVQGAREYLEDDPPLAVFSAAVQWAMIEKGKNARILAVYHDRLWELGWWFVQLWAESLGKQGKGELPVLFRGTLDQHSMLQLFMEGPADKVYTFVGVRKNRNTSVLPEGLFNEPALEDLNGKGLAEVFTAEAEATSMALIEKGRPVEWLTLDILDEWHLGALFMHFELETALTGYLMGINPFDQPGVELGKRYAHALLGRRDLSEVREELEARKARLSHWEVKDV